MVEPIQTVFEILKWGFSYVDKDSVAKLVYAFVARRRLFVSSVTGLLIATIWLGVEYRERSVKYSSIIQETIAGSQEETPQSYKGLEAFLLSGVDGRAQRLLSGATLSQGFLTKYERLATDLAQVQQLLDKHDLQQNHWDNHLLGSPAVPIKPELIFAETQKDDEVITDTRAAGFLFLPLDLVRSSFRNKGAKMRRGNSISAAMISAIADDKPLMDDIVMSRGIAEDLKSLDGEQFVDMGVNDSDLTLKAAQVYLITGNGMARIFSNAMQESQAADAYYANQFSESTYFPSRPYYRGAISLNKRKPMPLARVETSLGCLPDNKPRKVEDYFYVSKPYMDLGGNGMVITVSRLLTSYKLAPAVLSMDFTFVRSKNVKTALTSTIQQFDVKPIEATFVIRPNGAIDPEKTSTDPAGDLLKPDQQKLVGDTEKFIQRQPGDLASILGNIQRVDLDPSFQEGDDGRKGISVESGLDDGLIEVSVPLTSRQDRKDAPKTATFLLFSLDLLAYRKFTDVIGVFALIALGTFVGLLILAAVVSFGKNSALQQMAKELNMAFDRVAEVMEDSPSPYIYLSSGDEITNTNAAMAQLLGTTEDGLEKKIFRTLIDPAYLAKYDEIQAARRSGVTDQKQYALRLKRADHTSTPEYWISSAAVPTFDDSAGAGLPETFGIFLADEPRDRTGANSELPIAPSNIVEGDR